MAYHDTACPCGGKKLPDTLICQACERHASGEPRLASDLRTFHDTREDLEQRRWAAMRLLSASRHRNPKTRQMTLF